MKRKNIIIILLILSGGLPVLGQKMVTLDGYVNDMQSVYYIKNVGWLWENQLHNRFNLHLYPTTWLHASLQARTRFVQGNTLKKFQGYGNLAGEDAGWIDLALSKEGSYSAQTGYLISSMIDRAWVEFSAGSFVATVGRQRINWGQTLVWNPNDIFNTYSYFEVDYPERPGSDAIRVQYYTGIASTIEIVAKVDSSNQVSAAGYFRWNALNFDFQVLGGVLGSTDLILGAGWSGALMSTSFRGEVSYFRDLENFIDTAGYLLSSLGLDYTFKNSLWIQGEILYSAFAREIQPGSFIQLMSSDMNVKNLGVTEWSIFTCLSYPISPLITATVAGIYYPDWKGVFVGPSFDISLANRLSLSLISQLFSAEMTDYQGNIARENMVVGYTRVKYTF